jgi:hypothetical protein
MLSDLPQRSCSILSPFSLVVLNLTFAIQVSSSPKFKVPIYRGYNPRDDADESNADTREFIYTGKNGNREETQKQYILFSDLKARLTKGCELRYQSDWNVWLSSKGMPFPVWNNKGKLLEEKNFLAAITTDASRWKDKEKDRLAAQFGVFCGT